MAEGQLGSLARSCWARGPLGWHRLPRPLRGAGAWGGLSRESHTGPERVRAVASVAGLSRAAAAAVIACPLSSLQIHIDVPRMSPEALLLQPGVTEVRAGPGARSGLRFGGWSAPPCGEVVGAGGALYAGAADGSRPSSVGLAPHAAWVRTEGQGWHAACAGRVRLRRPPLGTQNPAGSGRQCRGSLVSPRPRASR